MNQVPWPVHRKRLAAASSRAFWLGFAGGGLFGGFLVLLACLAVLG